MERLILVITIITFLLGSCLSCAQTIQRTILADPIHNPEIAYLSIAMVGSMPNKESKKVEGFRQHIATAWALNNRYLLTAGHFCSGVEKRSELGEDSEQVRLYRHGSDGLLKDDEIFATITKIDEEKDLCLLESPEHPFLPLELATSLNNVYTGDRVSIIGAPYGIFPVRTDGYIIQRHAESWPHKLSSWLGDPNRLLFISANVGPGNSGGPVMFNDKVIGIIVLLIYKPHESCMAVPIYDIHEFIVDYVN